MKRDAFTRVEPTANSILIYTHTNDSKTHALRIDHGTSLIPDNFLATRSIPCFDDYGLNQLNVKIGRASE